MAWEIFSALSICFIFLVGFVAPLLFLAGGVFLPLVFSFLTLEEATLSGLTLVPLEALAFFLMGASSSLLSLSCLMARFFLAAGLAVDEETTWVGCFSWPRGTSSSDEDMVEISGWELGGFEDFFEQAAWVLFNRGQYQLNPNFCVNNRGTLKFFQIST